VVGEDPASQVYVRNKVAACEKAGFRSIKQVYPLDVELVTVLAKIAVLVFIIIFIQKRPQGIFAMKGRSAEA
jgi:branched-subunit amino acid ABC-type transport system permease component